MISSPAGLAEAVRRRDVLVDTIRSMRHLPEVAAAGYLMEMEKIDREAEEYLAKGGLRKMADGASTEGREVSPSGAVRDSQEGKGRFDLISPLALKELALVCEKGAATYAPRNWEAGMEVSRMFSSALRHLSQALARQEDEPHLAHAMWNCMAAIHTLEMIKRGRLPPELDDRPDYQRKMNNETPPLKEGHLRALLVQASALLDHSNHSNDPFVRSLSEELAR